MKGKQGLNFYYGKEAEQFSFYRIPVLLFKDDRFKGISSDAKLLYGLFLARMALSVKNGWIDDENRVYIYFTAKEVMEELNVGKEKCAKIFAELDSEKGCGLIIRKKQGLGKPDMLYVMNFMSCTPADADDNYAGFDDEEISDNDEPLEGGRKIESPEVRKSNFQKSENRTSGGSDIGIQEVRKSNSKYIDYNYIDNSYIDYNNIHPISSYQNRDIPVNRDVMDEIDKRNEYRDLIAENIEYDFIAKTYGQSSADEVLEIILDAVCSKKEYLWVSEEQIPQVVVKGRLLKLNYSHIEYVLDCMRKNSTKIHNIKSYMFTALYNSYSTMGHYYTAEANYDLRKE